MTQLQYLSRVNIFAAILLVSTSLEAAITPTGNVTPNQPWNTNTSAYVGRTSNGSLQVDGGSVLPTLSATLGDSSGVTGDATITGAGSQWNMRGAIAVGYNGTGILNIEDGAQLTFGSAAYLGRNSGSTGTAHVSGVGTKMIGNNGGIGIGYGGTGSLFVEDGAVVTTYSGSIGYDPGVVGTAVISGSGSQWNINEGLGIGWHGNGSLKIESGGKMVVGGNERDYFAYHSDATAILTVTGSGSQWSDSNTIYFGNSGDATLNVEAGGAVQTNDTYLGFNATASGIVNVTGIGSKWTNIGTLYVGDSGSGMIAVSNGGEVVTGVLYASSQNLFGNGTISATKGAVVDADLLFNAAFGTQSVSSFGSGGTLKITAAGGDLGVGYKGSGSLAVNDGVKIVSEEGFLGFKTGSTGTATVSGNGSKWITTGYLHIGERGNGSLSVENLGAVASNSISVGEFGQGTLNILGGSKVTSTRGDVGNYSTSTGFATVSGAGSRWDVSDVLFVGNQGTGELLIEAGGQVTSGTSFVRGGSGGRTGDVTVTGAGSQWFIGDELSVSEHGTLRVENGGRVVANTLKASLNYLQGNGTITTLGAILDADFLFDAAHPSQQTFAFGSGGTLTVNPIGELGVGYQGNGTLQILEGVTVNSFNGYLGYDFVSTGNGLVSGVGSLWAISDTLSVRNGSLTIEQGGKLTSAIGYVDTTHGLYDLYDALVTVTGAGSEWISDELNVGYGGRGTLVVEAGGVVRNTDGYVGRTQYEYGRGTAIVTGAGSQWINSGSLSVGGFGSGTLIVKAGGQVSSTTGNISSVYGDITIGAGRVVVSGTGSKWTMSDDLNVYAEGKALLTIKDGGEVSNAAGRLNAGATVKVTGHGSRWTNSGRLQFGQYAGRNSLAIEGGGYVGSAGTHLDTASVATITGPGSQWIMAKGQNPQDTGFLYVGSNSIMNLRDGGNVAASGLDLEGLATIDVGAGSLLSVGNGGLYNYGTIRLLANPGALPGSQHSPIVAGTWSGLGTYQAVGGTWDNVNHVFTVSGTIAAQSGAPVQLDLSQQQRVHVEDVIRGWTVDASMLAKGGSITFAATTLDSAVLNKLSDPGRSIFSGWNFAVSGSGFEADDPLFLSFAVPPSLKKSSVSVWKYNGSRWSLVDPLDLSLGNGYASFTATNGGAYALTVPEPGTFSLLILMTIYAIKSQTFGPRRSL